MVRLTEKSKTGLWHLRGVSWEQLREGHRITKTENEKIYGALCKLKDYEDSGMNPDQVAKAAEWRTLHNRSTENRLQHVRVRNPSGAAAAPV